MKHMHVAAGIIEDDDGRVLLAQRPPGKAMAGLWEFPGGKLEADETAEAALLRELREELHLDVRVRRALGEFRHTYDWGVLSLHVFIVLALNEPRASKDVHVFKWLNHDEIVESELSAADREPLRAYLKSRL